MTNGIEQGVHSLNDCGCCEGVSVQTPTEIQNQPGLSAIVYRIGTHSQFKQSMLANLSRSQYPQLSGLTTRSDDDFTIAILDAWATVADILTFYQERIENESYLRTATERRSILELARSIGYELRPGMAASTYLAFTMDDAPGAPTQTTIDTGTRVQSIPNPGEQAQTFETIAPIPARTSWNAMRPHLTKRHPYKDKNNNLLTTFYFDGIMTGLNLGDGVILVPDDDQTPVFCVVAAATSQPDLRRTQVDLLQVTPGLFASGLIAVSRRVALGISPQISLTGELNPGRGTLDGTTSEFLGQPGQYIRAVDLHTAAAIEGFMIGDLFLNLLATQAPPPGVLALRSRAALFGHNAPDFQALPTNLRGFDWVYTDDKGKGKFEAGAYNGRQDTWAEATLATYQQFRQSNSSSEDASNIYLDTTYPGIVNNSYVVLRAGDQWGLHQVNNVSDISIADFTLSGKVTRLTLDNDTDFDSFVIRNTTVYAQSEKLSLARLPILDPLTATSLDLDGAIEGLYIGQGLIVCGELETSQGNSACEYVTIQDVSYFSEDDGEGVTRLTLANSGLQNTYVRQTVTIYGNVAPATHGETRQEILGSGDGSQPYQEFALHQSPLTYTSAATPSGMQSSLQVYVNDIRWYEVPSLYGHGPTERIYISRTGDDGKTTVQFGDGITGARLPTGQENVRATYRTGSGLTGQVGAGQLTVLLTRPGGVRSATNPQAASGAADPEERDAARQNAPLHVLTLDRIVSLRDYEDFVRAFAGVAKALATWTWDGRRRGVCVTVAGPRGAAIDPDSVLYTNLLTAIQQAGDPFVPVQVKSYTKRFFRIMATVKINPDNLADQVVADIETALRTHFSFEARAFGQRVALSEVVATMQAVTGVRAVNVTALYRSYPIGQDPIQMNFVLPAFLPRAGADANVPGAELLTLDPAPIEMIVTQ